MAGVVASWRAGASAGLAALAAIVATVAIAAPPVAEKQPVTEDFFGTSVTDEYRWMEDMSSPRFEGYLKAQAAYSRGVLDRIPGRAALEQQIVALDNAGPAVIDVQLVAGTYFYRKSPPGAVNYSLVMRKGGVETVLVDPTRLGQAGRHVSIDYYQPSEDGSRVAYGLSEGGSEQSVMHILDTATGKDLPETIDRTNYASVSWRHDGKSFYYLRLAALAPGQPATDKYKNSKCYLHVLGTDPATDKPVLGAGLSPGVAIDPIDFPTVGVTPGSDVAFALIDRGVQNEFALYVAPLDKVTGPDAPWVKAADFGDDVTGLAIHGRALYLLTHKDAPRYKVLETDALKPDLAAARTVVPAGSVVVAQIAAAADGLYIRDMDGGPSRLRRLAYGAATAVPVALPYDGAIDALYADPRDPGAVFSYEGWVHSKLWNRYDPAAGRIVDTGILPPSPVDASAFESREVKATSADGTAVPLSIVYPKTTRLDGHNPVLIWGYGAYGISEAPAFAPRWFALLQHGGVWATCHVRGGGEYGEDWHLAGQKRTKPNSWADLIGCAQYMIDQGYTTAAQLGIEGGSAGGILVGGAMTARPDLFRVVLDDVGVSNALRSEFSENGPPNIPEFGSVATKDGFEGLYAMDALHHVKDGTAYPAVMLTTGVNDPRVPSWESAKMAARLQVASTSGRPVLLRVDYDAGHGIGSTREQRNHELADRLAFFFWQVGLPEFQPAAGE